MRAKLLFFAMLASLGCLLFTTALEVCTAARFFKVLTSTLFILTAVAGFQKSRVNKRYFMLIFTGLIFSLLGDVCLSLTEYEHMFDFGFFSFLIAQGIYIAAFCLLSKIKPVDFLVMLIFCIPTLGVIYSFDGFVFDGMRPLVTAYTIMISFMCSKAVSLKRADGMGRTAFILTAAGAILFFISDFILMFDLYYTARLSAAKYMNLTTYYTGQGLISLSLLYYTGKSSGVNALASRKNRSKTLVTANKQANSD
ncbi:MAG: lysoplasmalogenase [Oscillospiraceae bacterium]|jgi:uncharacterized membrane protein YhhN